MDEHIRKVYVPMTKTGFDNYYQDHKKCANSILQPLVAELPEQKTNICTLHLS